MTKLLKVLTLFLLIPAAAYAQDQAPAEEQASPAPPVQAERPQAPPPKDMTHIYKPDYCDFQIGFPEDPVVEQKCDGGENRDECYEQVSYTQTFGLDATVNFRAVCNQIGQEIKDRYDQEIMIATLEEMTKDSVVEKFNTTYHEDEEKRFRLAGLVGEGKVGLIPSIFVAQMWLGENSAFSVEAEIVGDAFLEPDALFRDIMRSIQYKGADAGENAETAPAVEAPEETPEESQPE